MTLQAAFRHLSLVASSGVFLAPSAAQANPFDHPDGSTHWYTAVSVPNGIDWASARAAAAAAGGYLATITSMEENAHVFALIDAGAFWTNNSLGPWIGGVQPPAAKEPAGGWMWTELEPFGYSNWHAGQPTNVQSANRIHFGGNATSRTDKWADRETSQTLNGYVVEYSGASSPTTVGLVVGERDASDGYTLINPWKSQTTYLVDSRGRVVNSWTSAFIPGMSAYLQADGSLLRAGNIGNPLFNAGGTGGVVERLDWDGKLIWSFPYSSPTHCQHHDIAVLPNGNILMIAWESKTRRDAIDAGRDPNKLADGGLWPDKVIEVKPTAQGGVIVWEWHAWDHLIQDYNPIKANYGKVEQHPERIDINFMMDSQPDWLHVNAIDYNARLDQILLSVPTFGEIWIIDHSTTTAEASTSKGGRSGKGGDLLYRWGNPEAYRGGQPQDRQLFFQHDSQWIADDLPGGGDILVFNNGTGRGHSSVDELVLPGLDSTRKYPMTGTVWGPAAPVWSYTAPTPSEFFAPFVSGAQRLPSGNTLICDGPHGRSFEVTTTGSTVWEYINPVIASGNVEQGSVILGSDNLLFRSPQYAPDHPGLENRTLTPGDPLEYYENAILANGSRLPHHAGIGTTVELSLHTPYRGTTTTRYFQLATSATNGTVDIDYRSIPLGVDPLLMASLANSYGSVFQGYFGKLDARGRGRAALAIPAIPALRGLELFTAFVVREPYGRNGFGTISNAVPIRIGY